MTHWVLFRLLCRWELSLPFFSIVFASSLFAEGTAQLIPADSDSDCISYVQGNDGRGKEGPTLGQPSTDWIYIHIQDPSTETIYFGFSRKLPSNQELYYQILSPDGSIHCSGKVASTDADSGFISDNGVAAYIGPTQIAGERSRGYQAIECVPVEAGDYAVLFNLGHPTKAHASRSKYYVHPFDITVANTEDTNPVAVPGRVFSYKWHLNTNSGRNRACMPFYTWTSDSMVIEMDMNGMQPHGYSVSFNNQGAGSTDNLVEDRKSTTKISQSVPEYRVFLNEPDPEAYPNGTPGRVNFVELNACTLDSSYCIMVNTTKPGELNVYIDLNRTGAYEEDTEDVYFPYQTEESGLICVPWDGIDGLGNPISTDTRGTVIVEFLAGVVHFPIYDPENHENGYRCSVLRPQGYTPLMYFDNRNTSIATYNLEGCDSLCNTWTRNSGDKVMVNTWLNTKTSTDSDRFAVETECPPIAVNDSLCTRVNTPIQANILDNDVDLSGELNPYSVTISELSPEMGSASFDSESGLLTFFPAENDSADVSFTYEICDSSSSSSGKLLCSNAPITFSIYHECLASTVLALPNFSLSVRQVKDQAILEWTGVQGCDYYAIERAVDEQHFKDIQILSANGQDNYRFSDKYLTLQSSEEVIYQIKAFQGSELIQRSTRAKVSIQYQIPLKFSINIPPGSQNIHLSYASLEASTLQVFDIKGSQIVKSYLPASPVASAHTLSSSTWGKGLFLVMISHPQTNKTYKIRIQ